MPDEVKNGLIGIFVIAGLAILVFIILFLHPQTGDEGQTLVVRFADIDKIQVGSRVTFAGKPVGEVARISEIAAPRDEWYQGDAIFPFELTLKLDSHVRVYNSDEITIHTSGLLGERSIAILPHHSAPGVKPKLLTEQSLVFADTTLTLEDVLEQMESLMTNAGDVLDHIKMQLRDIQKYRIWESLGDTFKNLADISGTLNVPTDWKSILTNFKSFSINANQAADSFQDFSNRLNTGQGTVSRLVNNDDLYLRLTAVMSKADTLMDDINHYGILFHNDKGWQRLRARRLNLLQKLETPQEFHNFFNDEINLIQTSLERVSLVLGNTFCACSPFELMDDPQFECLFADLLRRITTLEENIKMYNQQLITEHEKCRCGR